MSPCMLPFGNHNTRCSKYEIKEKDILKNITLILKNIMIENS